MLLSAISPSLLVGVLATAGVGAIAKPAPLQHSTHHARDLPSGARSQSYHPRSSFETFDSGLDHGITTRGLVPRAEEVATVFTQKRLGIQVEDLDVKSTVSADHATHVTLRQKIKGISVANTLGNVATNKAGKVVAFGSSFATPKSVADTVPTISEEQAVAAAEAAIDGKRVDWPVSIEYYITEEDHAALAYVVQVKSSDGEHWYQAFVDAHTGELIGVHDFTSRLTYRGIPFPKLSPDDGFELVVDPEDLIASPQGWVYEDKTEGNNVHATLGDPWYLARNKPPYDTVQTSPGVFNHTWTVQPPINSSLYVEPTVENLEAARVHAFYALNTIHDVAYRYGFTEATFNFQNDNFGKGGLGNDGLILNSADRYDSPFFSTPPDGQSPVMRQELWGNYPNMDRDANLENDILVHEYAHGITNRMTGGGTAICYQSLESLSLGEGLSDALAGWFQRKDSSTPDWNYSLWVTRCCGARGVRWYDYTTSTSLTKNPRKYSDVGNYYNMGEYEVGAVFASILYTAYASLVEKYGWSDTARTNPDGNEGNVVWLHLFMDALLLQPCNPTFMQARDAWIQADANRYGGANKCLLWKAFASRGLGTGAVPYTDNFEVPADC